MNDELEHRANCARRCGCADCTDDDDPLATAKGVCVAVAVAALAMIAGLLWI